ncbi:mismatch-specific DNA-glycosylase, partial [Streptomyces anulatus]
MTPEELSAARDRIVPDGGAGGGGGGVCGINPHQITAPSG